MQVSQTFEENIKKFITIDNKIKSAQEAVRILKKEKDHTSEDIMEYIKNNNLIDTSINIPGGKLQYYISKTSSPMSKEYIQERLDLYFKSKSKAKEVVDFLYNNRETREKETIKRTISRKK